MARTVRWAEAATEDLAEAAEFIARDSPVYAAALVREARAAALSLRHFADRGRVVPESNDPTIRELFIKHYRPIYQLTAGMQTDAEIHLGGRTALSSGQVNLA